jgi:hypothetical protein
LYPPPSGRDGVSGLNDSIPNGATAPGNVSIWPTTAPPDPVPTIGLTNDAGSLTSVPAADAAAEASDTVHTAIGAAQIAATTAGHARRRRWRRWRRWRQTRRG